MPLIRKFNLLALNERVMENKYLLFRIIMEHKSSSLVHFGEHWYTIKNQRKPVGKGHTGVIEIEVGI